MECKDDEEAAGAVGGGRGKAKEKTAFQIKKGAERSNNDDEDGLGFSTHSKRKLSLGLRHVGEERNVRGRCDGGWDSKLGTGKGRESVEKEMNPEGKSVHCNQTLAAFRKDEKFMLKGDEREVLMFTFNRVCPLVLMWCDVTV